MAYACNECGVIVAIDGSRDCVGKTIHFSSKDECRFRFIVDQDSPFFHGSLCPKCFKKLIFQALEEISKLKK